jgi:hypothetical protein
MLWKEALLLLDSQPHHLNPDGIVIVQIDPSEQEPSHSMAGAYDERRYGKTLLWFLSESSRTTQRGRVCSSARRH